MLNIACSDRFHEDWINIDFYATHTINENEFSNIDCSELILKKHPKAILQNKEADIYTLERMFNKKPFHIRIINKLRKDFNEYKSK